MEHVVPCGEHWMVMWFCGDSAMGHTRTMHESGDGHHLPKHAPHPHDALQVAGTKHRTAERETALALTPRCSLQLATQAAIDGSVRMTAQRQRTIDLFGPFVALASANRTGLPDGLKLGIESLSGLSLDAVQVHYNSGAPAQLGAYAFARGNHIHVAPGQERHLPHEAWHIVQQAQGRVAPRLHTVDGTPVNDDAGLEREADTMGAQAMQHNADPSDVGQRVAVPSRGDVTQCMGEELIAPIMHALGVPASTAAQFVQYLLPLSLGTTALLMAKPWFIQFIKFAYAHYQVRAAGPALEMEDEVVSEAEVEEEAASDFEPEVSAQLGPTSDEEEDEDQIVPEAEVGSHEAAAASSSVESIADFHWKGGKAQRDKQPRLTPYQKEKWLEFCNAGPLKRNKSKSAPKKNWNDVIFKSNEAAIAASVANVPAEPAYQPYRAVNLAGGMPFFVDVENKATGTKSSSKAGNLRTKPLAVVYGRFGSAHYKASAPAQVHVHFDDISPIDSHTGAHVKQGSSYGPTWGPGNASAQPELRAILDAGFRGETWKVLGTYLHK
jgi:hypothetical protein